MFCSTIIATIARPSLARAVQSVLEQQLSAGEFEVIVVNDCDQPLSEGEWMHSGRVRVIGTSCREKSIARNTGAAVARGKYLHFLDDDDMLLPGALETFYQLDQAGGEAALLYGATRLVDRKEKYLCHVQHELNGNCFVQLLAGEWIPLGSYAIEAGSFFAAGGFNPHMTIGEDSDLCRRIALSGDLRGSSDTVLCAAVGRAGSTANYDFLPEQSRRARELILNDKGAFDRMVDSAHSSYWHGRILRAYLTSSAWNLQHHRVLTAASRSFLGLRSLLKAGRHLVSPDYWRAVSKTHAGVAFTRGLQEARI